MKKKILMLLTTMMLSMLTGCGMVCEMDIHSNDDVDVSTKMYLTEEEMQEFAKQMQESDMDMSDFDMADVSSEMDVENFRGKTYFVYEPEAEHGTLEDVDGIIYTEDYCMLDSSMLGSDVEDVEDMDDVDLKGTEFMELHISFPKAIAGTNLNENCGSFQGNTMTIDLIKCMQYYKNVSEPIYVLFNANALDKEPVFSGIKNKAVTKKDVLLSVKDCIISDVSIKRNGKRYVNKNGNSSTEFLFTQDGKYEVTARSIKNKTKKITFTVDKTNPKVNVKQRTYNKPVTIKFSDKTSGIKSATLDGKKIKSGKKVKAKGKHKLTVKDKAGNKTIVRFSIS